MENRTGKKSSRKMICARLRLLNLLLQASRATEVFDPHNQKGIEAIALTQL
jgi:hypothetical protein